MSDLQGHDLEPPAAQTLARLTGRFAHDFNNLLGAISNHLYLLERQGPGAEQQLSMAAMRRSVDRGSLLTQELQRLAALRSGPPAALQLAQWLPERSVAWRSLLGRPFDCSVQVAPDTAAAWVDAAALELRLLNLALDAVEATPAGGTLRVAVCNAGPAEEPAPPGVTRAAGVQISVGHDALCAPVVWQLPAARDRVAPG